MYFVDVQAYSYILLIGSFLVAVGSKQLHIRTRREP